MPRRKINTVEYFPHMADTTNSDTLTILQNRFGNDGYAFWFKLLEKLCLTDGHYLDCNSPLKWQLLLAKTGVDEITTVEILDLLVEMGAIDKELWQSKLIWCQNLVDNLATVYANRRRAIPQKPITTVETPITTVETNSTDTDNKITTVSTVVIPQSKVEYSKVKKNNSNNSLFTTFWEVYPVKKDKGHAELAFKKLKPSEELVDILVNAIERQKTEREQAKGFIPPWKNPGTWIRGKCWEDEAEGAADNIPKPREEWL